MPEVKVDDGMPIGYKFFLRKAFYYARRKPGGMNSGVNELNDEQFEQRVNQGEALFYRHATVMDHTLGEIFDRDYPKRTASFNPSPPELAWCQRKRWFDGQLKKINGILEIFITKVAECMYDPDDGELGAEIWDANGYFRRDVVITTTYCLNHRMDIRYALRFATMAELEPILRNLERRIAQNEENAVKIADKILPRAKHTSEYETSESRLNITDCAKT